MFNKAYSFLRLVLVYKILIPVLWARKRLFGRRCAGNRLMINIGSAYFFEPAWKSMDYCSPDYPYLGRFLDYIFDLKDPSPWPLANNSVDLFYSSHTLEHIPQDFCANIMNEMYRCLKPGGAVRLTMPDFDLYYDAYLRGDETPFSISWRRFPSLEQSLISVFALDVSDKVSADDVRLDIERLSRAEFADRYIGLIEPEDLTNFSSHKNWWNLDKLSSMLAAAGFSEIVRSTPQGSQFSDMRNDKGMAELIVALFPENRMLGFDNAHPETSLFVEAVKK